MKKSLIIALLIFLIGLIIGLFAGYIYFKKNSKPVIIQGETIWKDRIIYKDIKTLSQEEKDKDLNCFYRSEFKLNLKPLDTNEYRISGSLCDRFAYKDITIECESSGNWKYALAIGGIIGLGTGIYLNRR